MDEERLEAIERHAIYLDEEAKMGLVWHRYVIKELLAEVRRLQKLSRDTDQAYSDGIDSGHADIVGIITDPLTGSDPESILNEIKRFLGEC